MSEYQYYEFRAVDRPMTAAQIEQVRGYSTRADISATRFVNEYHFGNFKGDVDTFLDKYFDAHVYLANWGTRTFAFRLPADLTDVAALKAYETEVTVGIKTKGGWVLIAIGLEQEPDDYDESDHDGGGWMDSLLGVRAEVLAGDLRGLYLGWLAGVAVYDKDEDGREDEAGPPVPPGMGALTGPQRSLADFIKVDPHLIAAAAEVSPLPPSADDLTAGIAKASQSQKDRWLLDLLSGEAGPAVSRVKHELRQSKGHQVVATGPKTTLGQLRRRAGEIEKVAREEKAAAAAVAKRRKEKAEADAREKRLDKLAGRTEAAWRQVDELAAKNGAAYGSAVAVLKDLQALADRSQTEGDFRRKLAAVLETHARKHSFIKAVQNGRLI